MTAVPHLIEQASDDGFILFRHRILLLLFIHAVMTVE
jgi:hypothetical protein